MNETHAEMVADLAGALRDFAAWHGTPEVVVRRADPPGLADKMEEILRRGSG
jgi:uncharacterized protein